MAGRCHAAAYTLPATAGAAQEKIAEAAQAPDGLQFPTAQYKDYALAANGSRLTAVESNIHRFPAGSAPEAQIIEDKDGYSHVNLPYLGMELNIPFGWASWGGFNTMQRIDFFPDPTHKSHGNLIDSSITLGIKVLNSTSMGGTSFREVFKQVQSFSGAAGKFTTEVDERHHAFLIKTEPNEPHHALVKVKSTSYYGLYLQDPNPDSIVWVNIDLHAPPSEFKKYAGLMGLAYRDIKINWTELEGFMRRRSASNAGPEGMAAILTGIARDASSHAPAAGSAQVANNSRQFLLFCTAAQRLLDTPPGTPSNVEDAAARNCIGYIQGVLDTITRWDAMTQQNKAVGPSICMPHEGVNSNQAVPIVVKYMNDHPEELDKPPVFITMAAMAQAYPCKN